MIKDIIFFSLLILFLWVGYAIDYSLVHLFQGLLGPLADGTTLVILWIAVLTITITPIVYLAILLAAVIATYFNTKE